MYLSAASYLICLYCIAIMILFVVIFFVYIRFTQPFWSIQPVVHYYDIHYKYFYKNRQVILTDLPVKNRFTNFFHIKTTHFDNLKEIELEEMTTLISQNYLRTKWSQYIPIKENITPYFAGHNANTFVSRYYIYNYNHNLEKQTRLIGVITGRPINVYFSGKKTSHILTQYVDYLCVDKAFRKMNIAPQLIQTHVYNQRRDKDKDIPVSLFKREGELTNIVPLCVFYTYGYNINNTLTTDNNNKHIYKLVDVDKKNIYYLYNFFEENRYKYDCFICPEISNLISLIDTNNLFIKMLSIDLTIHSVYIFKRTKTYLNISESKETNQEIVTCIASITTELISTTDFINGFKDAVFSLSLLIPNIFLTIEEISDNNIIIKSLSKDALITPFLFENAHSGACSSAKSNGSFNTQMCKTTNAYFFYNYIYKTINGKKVFIVI